MNTSNWIHDKIINNLSIKTYDLPASSLEEMKAGIDQIISRVLDTGNELTPVVIQNHSKHYPGNYENIRKFIEYLLRKYGSIIQFTTISELNSMKNKLSVRINGKMENSICA